MSRKWVETKAGLEFGGGLEAMINTATRFKGGEYVGALNECLRSGENVLVIGNHPNQETSVMLLGELHRKMEARSRMGVLISCKFFNEYGTMGWTGDLARRVMEERWGLELFKIAQVNNKQIPDEAREAMNLAAMRESLRVLKTPGSVLVEYPEGTRSPKGLLPAHESLGIFAGKASWVLPVISGYRHWRPGQTVRFMEPVSGREGVMWLRKNMGLNKDTAERYYSDYLMTLIASQLPYKRRGYYLEPSMRLEGIDALRSERWDHVHDVFEVLRR